MTKNSIPIKALIPGMRIMLLVASALVFSVGISLYVLTEQTDRYFAWTIQSALTAAFLGGAYWSSCVLEFLAARERHWANARTAVPAVIVFTTLTLVVTLLHLDRFHFNAPELFTRAGTWFWLAVYACVPIILLGLLVWQMHAPGIDPPRSQPMPGLMRLIQGLLGVFLMLLGMIMLISPVALIPMWPWALTALTARAVGAWMLGLGVAAGHCAFEGDLRRGRTVFISIIVFCMLQLIALARYASEFAWASTQANIYLAILLVIGLIGIMGIVLYKK